METPPHLGGHAGITHVDRGALEMLKGLGCRTMVDLGCGPGGQAREAQCVGLMAEGLDGDESCAPDILHDFTRGPFKDRAPDLVWCCEFVEHVAEGYAQNFAPLFRRAKYAVLTHALPRAGGHHHVNCQPPEYWQGFMAACGLIVDETLTKRLKAESTMVREFIQETGRVYVRR